MKRTPAIICDIDGTIAHRGNRSPYDWSRVGQDIPDETMLSILPMFIANGYRIILVSGRDSVCRQDTKDWLDKYSVPYHRLYMRAKDDNRKDYIVKREIYEKLIKPKYEVLLVLDDRNQTVEMWRDVGLKCLQVAEGDF